MVNSISILPQITRRTIKVDGRAIGWLEDGIFYKSVSGSRHMLTRPPAWAIDADAFDKEIKPHATEIVVKDKETGLEYQASVDTFDRFKREINRGFGRQYYLIIHHWRIK